MAIQMNIDKEIEQGGSVYDFNNKSKAQTFARRTYKAGLLIETCKSEAGYPAKYSFRLRNFAGIEDKRTACIEAGRIYREIAFGSK